MACAAGLPGLAREARKRLRGRRKGDCQEADQNGNDRNRSEQPAVIKGSSKTAAIAPHRATPLFATLRANARILTAHESNDSPRVENAAKPIAAVNPIS